jgi:glycine/D-amino acid oxidase-like deaminating enzyme
LVSWEVNLSAMSAILQQKFTDLQKDQTEDRVIIIGGGIVGSSLAYYLSKRNCDSQIILLDSSLDDPHNSTAFAPGLVGQLNTITHLTEMAKETVSEYSKITGVFSILINLNLTYTNTITGGFQQVGGLEIASTEAGIAQLHSRHSLARTAGLPSQILNSVEASQLAPDFAINDEGSKGLFFPLDGTADSKLISKYYLSEAKSQGVILLSLKVTSISQPALAKYPAGYNLEVSTELGFLGTKKLIVATGIWTSELVKTLGIDLPIVPVLHPYAHGPERSARGIQQPFVRWPERHIYARDHGNSDGWGSYDHEPIRYAPANSALLNSSVQRYDPIYKKVAILIWIAL